MSVSRALTYPVRWARARTRTAVNGAMHRAEVRRGSRLEPDVSRAPILIIGPPRSGATLFHQLLVEQFDIGWMANAHMAWPGGVSRTERRDRPRAGYSGPDYTSKHGDTAHPWGVSEAEGFWYRFFPRSRHQANTEDATLSRVGDLRAAVREFAAACGQPTVFKNPFNSLRMPVITSALPDALFIQWERDVQSNARSALFGRIRNGGIDRWWSARPDGADQIATRENPATQAVWQVTRPMQLARAELAELDPARVLVVSYEEVCRDPRGALDRFEAWLHQNGVPIERRPNAKVPAQFTLGGSRRLDAETERQLRDAVARFEAGELLP